LIFFAALTFVLLFWLLFSGDASIFGIQIYYISFLLFLIHALLNKISFPSLKVNNSIFLILLMGCFFSSTLADYSDLYSLWTIKVITSYIFFLACIQTFNKCHDNKLFINVMALSSFIILILFVFGTAMSKTDRGSFIFGPNILYRVFTILSMFSALLVCIVPKHFKTIRVTLLLTLFLICSAGIYFTGSRGGLIVLSVLFLFKIHLFYIKIPLRKLFICILTPLCFGAYFVYELLFLDINNSRFSNFDYEGNESLSYRLAPWIDFLNSPSEWILSTGHSYIDFMMKFGSDVFPYPHNIFLELMLFNGLTGFLLSVFIVYQYVIILVDVLRSYFGTKSLFFYITTIVLIGSLFSGNLQDNYLLISLLMALNVIKNETFKNT